MKEHDKEIGPAELRLRMLLANPPKRSVGLLHPESFIGWLLLFVWFCLYFSFVCYPAFHEGRFLTDWLFEWFSEVWL
ncbi:hypothetical protein [Aeromonas hydrophila]|uniref:hypothetical protein n=1 Tax=Aeromonas hydrophila TaxID=644 RepID=UPI003D205BB3